MGSLQEEERVFAKAPLEAPEEVWKRLKHVAWEGMDVAEEMEGKACGLRLLANETQTSDWRSECLHLWPFHQLCDYHFGEGWRGLINAYSWVPSELQSGISKGEAWESFFFFKSVSFWLILSSRGYSEMPKGPLLAILLQLDISVPLDTLRLVNCWTSL